jgi:hypothetical protein
VNRAPNCKTHNCTTCAAVAGSQSYREFDCTQTPDSVGMSPEARGWFDWFKAHNIPAAQVPWKGWAARDVERRTVSVKVLNWHPGDEDSKDMFGIDSVVYTDRDDDGHWASRDGWYGVHTVQLDSIPLPFPELPKVAK